MKLQKHQRRALQYILPLLRKHKIPFQISGGFAAKVYGSKRKLNDIDIDLPDTALHILAPLVREYIISGPDHYREHGFDLSMIELKYHGQQIDLCGHTTMKILDSKKKRYVKYPGKLSEVIWKRVDGFLLPVIPAHHLAAYKRYLKGAHQRADVRALETLLNSKA